MRLCNCPKVDHSIEDCERQLDRRETMKVLYPRDSYQDDEYNEDDGTDLF